MKILIVEDEPLAAERLERLIKDVKPEAEILAKIDSLERCEQWLPKNKPELIFMDIHLSDGSSFKLFERNLVASPVVFCTAYDQYAIKAFQNYAIDYLLKPVTKESLLKSFSKIQFLQSSLQQNQSNIKTLLEEIGGLKKTFRNRFMVQYGQKIKSIEINDIAYFYAQSKLVYLRAKDGSQYVLETSLDKLENDADPNLFFRINRKFIIQRNAIEEMLSFSKGRIKITLSPNIELESIVSIDKAGEFKQWLNT